MATAITVREYFQGIHERAQEAKLGRPCPTCKFYPFFESYGTAVLPGHVYSQNGRAELGITGMCEFCWDQMEPEDERAERTGGAFDPDVPHDLPLEGMVLQTVTNLNDYDVQSGRYDTDDKEAAQVITSLVDGRRPDPAPFTRAQRRHKLVIDLDLPAKLIPSSTPGHFHLYVDHEMDEDVYMELLTALGKAGLLEEGYVRASHARKLTAVRLPWVKKPSPTAGELVDQYLAEQPVAAGGDEPWPF